MEGNIHHAKDAIELVTINIWKSLAKLQKHLNKANRKNRSDNVKLNQQLWDVVWNKDMSNSIISNLSHRNVDMNEPDGEKHLECISNEDHVSNEDAAVMKTNQKSPVVHQPFNEDNGTITEQPVNMDNQK